jgi:hypothetical protein
VDIKDTAASCQIPISTTTITIAIRMTTGHATTTTILDRPATVVLQWKRLDCNPAFFLIRSLADALLGR